MILLTFYLFKDILFCRTTAAALTVVVGTTTLNSSGTAYNVNKLITHTDFDFQTYENDIALVRVASAIVGSSTVTSIPLSTANLGAGFNVTFLGWGSTAIGTDYSNELQFINLRTISNNDCKTINSPNPIFDGNICAVTQTRQAACSGDNGGPLVYEGILIGVVSLGVPCDVRYADVFARTSYYIDWIQSNAT